MHIKCFHPPINITHIGTHIYVPEDDVYEYTKKLYEKGLGHKSIPSPRESEIRKFFVWKSKYESTSKLSRWLIDKLM